MASAPYYVHPTAVVDDGAVIGEGTKIWHFAHVMGGARVGADCVFGQGSFVGNVRVGDRARVQNHVSIFDGVELEDEVFCGPHVAFTNVLRPRAGQRGRHPYLSTRVRRGATLGANATVICGVDIGAFAFVGAGAVVRGDVAPHEVVAGAPARRIGWMCACGERLEAPPEREYGCEICAS